MRIVFLPEVIDYFNELVTILYEKQYFSFEEYAYDYLESLLDDIRETLPLRPSKPAPTHFDRYGKGMRYVAFTKYKVDDEAVYLIRHISNNHVSAQYL